VLAGRNARPVFDVRVAADPNLDTRGAHVGERGRAARQEGAIDERRVRAGRAGRTCGCPCVLPRQQAAAVVAGEANPGGQAGPFPLVDDDQGLPDRIHRLRQDEFCAVISQSLDVPAVLRPQNLVGSHLLGLVTVAKRGNRGRDRYRFGHSS
jgi:hypothetical protein